MSSLKRTSRSYREANDADRVNSNLYFAYLRYFSWLLFLFSIYFLATPINVMDKGSRQILFGFTVIILLLLGKK